MSRVLHPDTPSSVLLREAAKLVDAGRRETACYALSSLLPDDPEGAAAWWKAKEPLGLFLPLEGFETTRGWWRDREPRVLAMLMAADIAEDDEYSGNS